MGCDIHGFVEVDSYNERLKEREEKWNEDYETMIKPLEKKGVAITKDQWLEKTKHRWDSVLNIRPLLTRNYDLFAFFFGVRRERPEEHYGYPAIADNRGLPEDVSWLTKTESNELDTDGHSHSWIGLDEIKKIDWSKPQGKISDFVRDKEFRKLVKIMEIFNDGSDKNVRLVVWFDN